MSGCGQNKQIKAGSKYRLGGETRVEQLLVVVISLYINLVNNMIPLLFNTFLDYSYFNVSAKLYFVVTYR